MFGKLRNTSLKDKVALVTGSSRGIGLAIANELALNGAKVVLNSRSKEQLEKAYKQLLQKDYDVFFTVADVTSPDECERMIAEVVEKFGKLDILVNNAGISMKANLDELDAKTCKRIVDTNLLGCIYPTLFSISQIKMNKGSIVFISSIAGIVGLPGASLYSATKMGLTGLTESLRCELLPFGVSVGIVYVGFTENDPDKKIIGPGNKDISPNRPMHMTQAKVAKYTVNLIRKRKRQVVLSPAGKLAKLSMKISPYLVEKAIITSRKYNLAERLGIS